MVCEWCGSSKHPSEECRTRNLVRCLTDSPEYDDELGLNNELVVIDMGETDEGAIDGLAEVIKEIHAKKHIRGLSDW